METLLAGFAEFENEVRKQRCTAGMQSRVRDGIWPWQPPVGYVHSKKRTDRRKTQPDQPDPDRFYHIQNAFRIYLTGDYTMSKIVALMNQRGMQTRTGKPVRKQFVEKMLKEKFYAGILTDPWTGEEYVGAHQPMISPEEYYRIQQIKKGFSNNANKPHRRENPDFPLRGYVLCTCGVKMTAGWSKGKTKRYAYYYCKNRKCEHFARTIARRKLEENFVKLLEHIAPKEAFLQAFKEVVIDVWHERHKINKQERKNYEVVLKRVTSQKTNLIRMRANGEISKEEFENVKNELELQITGVTVSRNEASTDERHLEADISYATQFISDIARLWMDMTDTALKYRLQKRVLPEGAMYDKTAGKFRTPVLSPIFELNRQFMDDESGLVACARPRLNSIYDELTFWHEFTDAISTANNLQVQL